MKFAEISSMTEERIDKLGDYFVYHAIHARTGMTFDSFLRINEEYRWNPTQWLV